MKYIEIKLPKHVIYLTTDEIQALLCKNIALYEQAIKRGKAFKRCEKVQQWQQKQMKGNNDAIRSLPRDGDIA